MDQLEKLLGTWYAVSPHPTSGTINSYLMQGHYKNLSCFQMRHYKILRKMELNCLLVNVRICYLII